ncbi:MAG TPA: hypothetical protein VNG13_13360 [Mycobacteriales bacterium]|nr:hypothetical protein [Mycobacteriales bacterium]
MIISLQVLGQAGLNFKVSVAQILISVAVCGLVEIGITYRRQQALVWPASAILTGNGVAFILRAAGTRHGQWWTLHGVGFFILAALIGLLSKYLIKPGGRQVYNPSNLGLVACLLVVSSPDVFPQYLWWGPLNPPVITALAIILLGVVWVLRPVGMLPMTAAFLVPFGAMIGGLAATGHCFAAIWHTGPVCGLAYWHDITLSPELLIFVFYMMSDPKTAPRSARSRLAYAGITALIAAGLIAFQPTEYGVKVALLAALTIVCSLVPALERACDRPQARGPRSMDEPCRGAPRQPASEWRHRVTPSTVAVALILVTVPLAVSRLAGDQQLLNLERGITTSGTPPSQ